MRGGVTSKKSTRVFVWKLSTAGPAWCPPGPGTVRDGAIYDKANPGQLGQTTNIVHALNFRNDQVARGCTYEMEAFGSGAVWGLQPGGTSSSPWVAKTAKAGKGPPAQIVIHVQCTGIR